MNYNKGLAMSAMRRDAVTDADTQIQEYRDLLLGGREFDVGPVLTELRRIVAAFDPRDHVRFLLEDICQLIDHHAETSVLAEATGKAINELQRSFYR